MFDKLKYRLKYRYGKYLHLKVPVDVSMELSSYCNMRCSYCYHSDKKNLPFSQGFMSKEMAFDILRQCSTYGVHSVKMNWKGESTMNPAFSRICKEAKRLAHGPVLMDRITNSNFMFDVNRNDIFEGLACQTKVKVSFDSFYRGVFNRQRSGGDWDTTWLNINKFYNWPGRDNELVIQAVRTERNKHEDLEKGIKLHWPSATVSIRDMVEGRVEKDLEDLAHKKRDLSSRQRCGQAFTRIIFNKDGIAYPCCPDVKEQLPIGSIRHNIYEIFNSQKARMLRDDLRSKKAFESDPCKNCSSFETYKGFKPSWNS